MHMFQPTSFQMGTEGSSIFRLVSWVSICLLVFPNKSQVLRDSRAFFLLNVCLALPAHLFNLTSLPQANVYSNRVFCLDNKLIITDYLVAINTLHKYIKM